MLCHGARLIFLKHISDLTSLLLLQSLHSLTLKIPYSSIKGSLRELPGGVGQNCPCTKPLTQTLCRTLPSPRCNNECTSVVTAQLVDRANDWKQLKWRGQLTTWPYVQMMEYYTDTKVNEAAFYTVIVYTRGSQSVVPGPAASVSPGNLLEMYVFRPHLLNQRLEWGPAGCILASWSGRSNVCSILRTAGLLQCI